MKPCLGLAALSLAAAVGGCGDGALTPVARAGLANRVTLARIAVESNRSVAAIVDGGQLFCEADGYVFAVLAADAEPSSVSGQPPDVVARACQVIGPAAIPVIPPSNPAGTPTVVPPAPIIPPAR